MFQVSEGERKGSEIDYMKKYHEDWLKNGGGKDQTDSNLQADFIKNHPTYTALIKSKSVFDTGRCHVFLLYRRLRKKRYICLVS